MKAAVYSKKAKPGRLVILDIDKPVPKAQEVLIRIRSVSLNAADYRSMQMGLIPKGKIFGADISGTIESTGSGVTLFKTGDHVLGDLAGYGFGGLAEYVAVDEKAVVHKPDSVSFEAASAIPMAGVTALQALRDKGNIKAGHKVLIVGSAGGVGTFAVKLAKYFGAEVTGVCSGANVMQAKKLGADHVIDYSKEDFMKGKTRYDLILGVNGNYPLSAYRRLLGSGGTYVMVGGGLPQIFKSLVFGWLFSFGSRKMKSVAAKPGKNDLDFLAKLAADGKIIPVIDRTYTLDEAPAAMEYLSKGHSKGKVIVKVG